MIHLKHSQIVFAQPTRVKKQLDEIKEAVKEGKADVYYFLNFSGKIDCYKKFFYLR